VYSDSAMKAGADQPTGINRNHAGRKHRLNPLERLD